MPEDASLPRLLALDIDGTLLPSGGQISDRTIRAVRAAEAAGIVIVIATGRRWRTARMVLEPLGAGQYLIGSSGALVREIADLDKPKIIRRRYMTHADALAVCRAALALDLTPVWFDTPDRTRRLFVFGQIEGNSQLEIYSRSNPDAFVERTTFDGLGDALEIVCFGRSAQLGALARQVGGWERRPARAMTWNSARYLGTVLEIIAADASKGAALAWLSARLGIDRSDTVAVGDDINDLEMLNWAGRAWGIEGGAGPILEVVDGVLPPPQREGVADLIEGWLAASYHS